MRIGVLTGGGDCPGLNAVIRAVVRSSLKLGYDILGIKNWIGKIILGATVLGAYGVAAWIGIHKLIVSTPLSRKIYARMSLLQYVTMQIFLITMLFLPIKILLRLSPWTIKYVLVTPWFNV